MELWYTYVLTYPDGTVFYVGKGIGDRIDIHEKEAANGGSSHKCKVIRSIWANGDNIMKYRVFESPSEEDVLIYEWFLINIRYGIDNLTNIQENNHYVIKKPTARPSRNGAGRQRSEGDIRKLFERWWTEGRGVPFRVFYRGELSTDITEYYEKRYVLSTGVAHEKYLHGEEYSKQKPNRKPKHLRFLIEFSRGPFLSSAASCCSFMSRTFCAVRVGVLYKQK